MEQPGCSERLLFTVPLSRLGGINMQGEFNAGGIVVNLTMD